MVARIWHGWTTPENDPLYHHLLITDIFPGIRAKNLDGYRKIQLIKRLHEDEVEFITIMWFESLDNIKDFAGKDYETAYVPPQARDLLKRFDKQSQHYNLLEEFEY